MFNPVISRVLFCLVMLSASRLQAEDWTGWRGPLGNGISSETDVPLHWSATENIAWKTPIPGRGLSSPIVTGDRVFVTSGDPEDGSRHVYCLNRLTGDVDWDAEVFRGPPGKMHRYNTTASSTPVTDGERVFAVFNDDTGLSVSAVDLGGRIVWSKRVGTFYSNHGFAASPVIFEGGVIVNGQQDGEAFAAMLDRATGEERWRYVPDVNLRSFSTPVFTVHEGVPQMILTGSTQTVAINPATGRKIWSANGPTEKFVCTPSVGHGLVFSFGGSPEKKAMAVRLGGQGDVTATHIAWQNDRAMPYVPSPLLLGDYLHIVNDQGVYLCLEPQSGKTLMSARKLGAVYSSPIAAANRIYLFEDSGACTVIGDGQHFQELARNELGELVQTTPAVARGQLLVRTDANLICIGR